MTIERGPELWELLKSRFVQCYYEAVIVPMKMRSSFETPFNPLIGRLTLLWPLMIEPLVPRQHRRPLIIVTSHHQHWSWSQHHHSHHHYLLCHQLHHMLLLRLIFYGTVLVTIRRRALHLDLAVLSVYWLKDSNNLSSDWWGWSLDPE